ncbi:MAG: xanthine dehydrogenase family protein molybdopterin-binding subunit [Hyphomicrobiaceae bacterium]|nr:xanthine dehydrogenase family protein molybdopterin-binding subunit [Hyphomicrobiaceae bacterium]
MRFVFPEHTAEVTPAGPDRRFVLKSLAGAGAGLVLGLQLPSTAQAQSGAAAVIKGEGAAGTFAPNAFVRIAPDSTVTVLIKHIEFGQGPFTGLATLVAEELDADWGQMRAEHAPADTALYKNTAFGLQGTGGSTAIANSYEQMRKAGAAARAMLVTAAAKEWGVPAGEISVSKGVIVHAQSGRSASFGAFAAAAASLPVPADVKLKDPAQFSLIGTDVPKLDSAAKSAGKAQFTMDATRPGMLTCLIARPDRFGGTVKSVDDAEARKVPGVADVRVIPQGVAVYAKGYFAAQKAREALKIEWDNSRAETRSTDTIIAEYQKLAASPGKPVTTTGDAPGVLAKAAKVIEAEYVFPYLAHAPMEPLDCLIEAREDGAEVWAGSQLQTIDQTVVAQILGLRPEEVRINTLFAGGSFGRRATPGGDMVAAAAEAVKAIGRKQPVKVVWSREDDIRGGYYRPLNVHRLRASLAADGTIAAWEHTLVGQSLLEGTPLAGMIKDGIDPTTVEGANDLPYALANMSVSVHTPQVGVPVLWWRSVGHTHTAYSTETFLDELLALAGKDAVAGRLALMGDKHPRHAGVLKAVAEMADWGGPVPDGRARGVAVHRSFNSYVAQIAEVSKGSDGAPRVHKVWCAVDCGVAVNPNVIAAQMEGGIGYGLGHALYAAITMKDGRVVESNFDAYRSLRINEMPEVAVRIVKSAEAPTGVGEPGTPPIAPAVANAWAKLTGERVRQLPFVKTVG